MGKVQILKIYKLMQNVCVYYVFKFDEVLTFGLHCENFQSHKMVFENLKTQFFNILTVIIFLINERKNIYFHGNM